MGKGRGRGQAKVQNRGLIGTDNWGELTVGVGVMGRGEQ